MKNTKMKNKMMKKLYKNLTKHLTVSNFLVSMISLFIGFIFKYSGLPLTILQYFLEKPSDDYIYLISGLVVLFLFFWFLEQVAFFRDFETYMKMLGQSI